MRELSDELITKTVVMTTQGEKGVDLNTRRGRCLFHLRRRQDSWSQAVESKLGLKAITGSHKRARKRLSRVKRNNTSQRHTQNELN